jgi:hydroxymethylglutaryl-CoA synthase
MYKGTKRRVEALHESHSASLAAGGVVGARAAEVMARARLDEILDQRVRIDVREYERIMNLPYDAPASQQVPGAFRFAGFEDNRRTYIASPFVG